MSAPPAARVFSIPSGVPFLPALARAMIDGTLTGRSLADPIALAEATVYLPTRRAARTFGSALSRAMASDGILLPHITALGSAGDDVSEMAGDAFAADGDPAMRGVGAAAVSTLERQLVLADITLDWARSARSAVRSPTVPDPVPRTPSEAVAFARELERLFDHMTSEGIDIAALGDVIPDDLSHLARNWEVNLTFLMHAMRAWRSHLQTRGLGDQVERRDAALRTAAARLEREGSAHPVIAAGSTGSVPATAELLRAIAGLHNGAVVLPGLDQSLDSESWECLEADHPQFGLKLLLEHLGIARGDVVQLGDDHGTSLARRRLFSEVMRPAETADRWVGAIASMDRGNVEASLDGLSLVEAADEHLEARTVALILRGAMEDPARRAALVTPDRDLARRVAAELSRWNLSVDDSAGRPLALSRHGTFLRLVIGAAEHRFGGERLLSLLKHPLCRLGLSAAGMRNTARIIELCGLRGVLSGTVPDPAVLAETVRVPADDPHAHPAVLNLDPADRKRAASVVERLATAADPLTGILAGTEPVPPTRVIEALFALAEVLAETPSGEAPILWAAPDGEAMALFGAELLAAGAQARSLQPRDIGAWFDTVLQGAVVRTPFAADARIAIWGPLEARLQSVDLVILGGLNEDTWPAQTRTDPWLGRNMRHDLGLDPPERRIGLQAHDFAQGAMAPQVVLTRAAKSEGTPSVPARWIWRLRALLEGLELSDRLVPDHPWSEWAKDLDTSGMVTPCAPPAPTPPVDARPQRFSVTAVETLVRDPYAIYARRVLGLEPMPPLTPEPDASDYGMLIHAALGELLDEHPTAPLPDAAVERLLAIGTSVFASLDRQPGIRAYWWNRFERIARWFVADDRLRREAGTTSRTEIAGAIDVPVPGTRRHVTLTARADRIDIDRAGRATVIDYKTGSPPSGREIETFMAPQLPLEAAVLTGGGFSELGTADVAGLAHMTLTGRNPVGRCIPIEQPVPELAESALEKLMSLLALYADPAMPYVSRRAPKWAEIAGPYDHLARVGEWSVVLGRSHDG